MQMLDTMVWCYRYNKLGKNTYVYLHYDLKSASADTKWPAQHFLQWKMEQYPTLRLLGRLNRFIQSLKMCCFLGSSSLSVSQVRTMG